MNSDSYCVTQTVIKHTHEPDSDVSVYKNLLFQSKTWAGSPGPDQTTNYLFHVNSSPTPVRQWWIMGHTCIFSVFLFIYLWLWPSSSSQAPSCGETELLHQTISLSCGITVEGLWSTKKTCADTETHQVEKTQIFNLKQYNKLCDFRLEIGGHTRTQTTNWRFFCFNLKPNSTIQWTDWATVIHWNRTPTDNQNWSRGPRFVHQSADQVWYFVFMQM